MLEMRQSVGVRDTIVTALLDVHCRDDLRAAETSGLPAVRVSDFVFYGQSESKEALASAFLKVRHTIWMHWLENEIHARYEATGGGLEIIADVLQEGFQDPKSFRFCLYRCCYQV